MDLAYKHSMDIDTKEQLARKDDMGPDATRLRLIASRILAGFDVQKDFAKECGISNTSYNNMEKGLSFPNREVMKYLYRAHRIDFNFIINGNFSQLPSDVQSVLFEKLLILKHA